MFIHALFIQLTIHSIIIHYHYWHYSLLILASIPSHEGKIVDAHVMC
jgi:hypothetical protein